jgi:Asp-tRNA(Asn)/Glu-tRNA(Gln) amidotransferase A subunit family amidase
MRAPTVVAVSEAIRQQKCSAGDLAAHFLAQSDKHNPALNAILPIDRQSLDSYSNAYVSEAAQPQRREPLLGAALAIKDLIAIADQVTSAASHLFADNRAVRDAEVVSRLRDAGAMLACKTNLHEFAYGGSGVVSAFGPARNPWNTAHITGGSSSGSAAAVAAGICAAAIGTDTAGSIRLPASFCGIVGFKPSFGSISTDGVVPLAESYDHVGPMTQSVEDARILFAVMSGVSAPDKKPVETLRVGVPERYFYRELDGDVGNAMAFCLRELENEGHSIVNVDFPVDDDRTLASFEAYAYHAKWVEQSPELYQPETLRRICSGAKITRGAALAARRKLEETRASSLGIFESIDVLLTPTVAVLPPKIDDLLRDMDTLRQRELVMLRNTRPFNVLGVPAISIPWDLSRSGLPIGIQLAAPYHKDFELLAIAEEFEKISPWQGRTPPGFD